MMNLYSLVTDGPPNRLGNIDNKNNQTAYGPVPDYRLRNFQKFIQKVHPLLYRQTQLFKAEHFPLDQLIKNI